jgi:hypothetical protein
MSTTKHVLLNPCTLDTAIDAQVIRYALSKEMLMLLTTATASAIHVLPLYALRYLLLVEY